MFGLPRWLSGKESACKAEDTGELGVIPGLGKSPEEGTGNPLQYSSLENSMDRGVWRVTNSPTRLGGTQLLYTAKHTPRFIVFAKHENFREKYEVFFVSVNIILFLYLSFSVFKHLT